MKNHFNSQTNRLNYLEGKISAYQNIRAEFEYKTTEHDQEESRILHPRIN